MSRFVLCLMVSLGMAIASLAAFTPTVSAQFFLPRPVTPTEMATGMTPQQIESLPILERPDRPGHIYGNTVRRIYRAQMQQQKMQQQMAQQQQAQKQAAQQAAEEKQAAEPEQTAEQKPAEQKQTHSVLQQAPQEETPKQTAAQPQVQTQTAAQQAQQQATQPRPAQQRRVQRVAPPPFVPFVLQPAGAM